MTILLLLLTVPKQITHYQFENLPRRWWMMVMINSTIMINRNHINGFNNCNVRAVEPAAVQFPTFMDETHGQRRRQLIGFIGLPGRAVHRRRRQEEWHGTSQRDLKGGGAPPSAPNEEITLWKGLQINMHNHKVVDWDYPRRQLFALDWNYTFPCFDHSPNHKSENGQENFPWIPIMGCFKLVICPSSCAGIEFGQLHPSEIWQPWSSKFGNPEKQNSDSWVFKLPEQ